MPSHSAAERQALADVLTEAGPGAPTLCSGWTTTDLAAHLVVRESRPHVRVADAVGPLRRWAAQQERTAAERPYTDLVTAFRDGPPRLSPFALPGADERANLLEHFIHCEDVRRAVPEWAPRTLPGDRQAAFWKTITGVFGKAMLRKAEMPVSLQVPGGQPVEMRKGVGGVVLVGEPGEVAMYLFGRKDQARVEILGSEEQVARFRKTPMRT